jgi:TRAP-type C4-dicarboxylate transport system substrate-binding protein
MEAAANEMRAQLEEKGMEIFDLSDELLADMLEASAGVYDMISTDIGSEYLEAVQAGLGK